MCKYKFVVQVGHLISGTLVSLSIMTGQAPGTILVAGDVNILASDHDGEEEMNLINPDEPGKLNKLDTSKLTFDLDGEGDAEPVPENFKRFDASLAPTAETIGAGNTAGIKRRHIRKRDFTDVPMMAEPIIVHEQREEESRDEEYLADAIARSRLENIKRIRQQMELDEQDALDVAPVQGVSLAAITDKSSVAMDMGDDDDDEYFAVVQPTRTKAEPTVASDVNMAPSVAEVKDRVPILEEPLVSSSLGVGQALRLMSIRGKALKLLLQKGEDDTRTRDIKLAYYDEFGNEISAKEAYKHLSHRFHGNKSGKNKEEKRLKRLAERKQMASEGLPIARPEAPKRRQKQRDKKPAAASSTRSNAGPQKPKIFGMK